MLIVRHRFKAQPSAPALARQAVCNAIGDWARSETVEQVVLLVSELVTNAVVHGGLSDSDEIQIELARNGRLRVDVVDRGSGFHQGVASSDFGGWGLMLVERLAERWGIVRNAETRVWFEVTA